MRHLNLMRNDTLIHFILLPDETTEGEPLTPEVIESIENPETPTVVEDIEDHAIDGEIVQIGDILLRSVKKI